MKYIAIFALSFSAIFSENMQEKERLFLDMIKNSEVKSNRILDAKMSVSLEGIMPSLYLSLRSPIVIDHRSGYGKSTRVSFGTNAFVLDGLISASGDLQFLTFSNPLAISTVYWGPRVAASGGQHPKLISLGKLPYITAVGGYTLGYEFARKHSISPFIEGGIDLGVLLHDDRDAPILPLPYPRLRIGTNF